MILEPTMNLRWRVLLTSDRTFRVGRELQQMWRDVTTGREEWRPVPNFEEVERDTSRILCAKEKAPGV